MEDKIFGINPILEILKSTPERIQQVYLPVGDLKDKKALIYSLACVFRPYSTTHSGQSRPPIPELIDH